MLALNYSPTASIHSLINEALNEYLRIPPSIDFLPLQKDLEQKYFFDKALKFQNDFALCDSDAEHRVVAFLKAVWDDIKPNSLSYTCHPNSKSTKLMCKLATYAARSILNTEIVTGNQNGHCLEIIIQLLMPGIIFECSDVSPYEGGSWDQVSIYQLLNSHILSSDQRYLIPVNCLSKLVQIDADISKIENIHAIIFGDTKHTYLDANELNRIKYHSAETQEVFSAYEALQTLAKQDVSSLFSQINLLLKELYINSVQGFGSELVAGSTAERAIRHFVHFYKQLTPPQKDSLPVEINEQIKHLHICIADYSLGRLEDVNAYTICMATRRQKLKEAIQGHQKLLSHCTLLDSSATTVMDAAMERLSNGVLSLQSLIKDSNEGQKVSDRLPLEFGLLARFELSVIQLSIDDLTLILQGLSQQEINSFLLHPLYKNYLLSVLTKHLDDYCFLLSQLSIEQFKAVLYVTPKAFFKKILTRLLSFFDIEQNRIVFDDLITPYLEDLIFKKDFLFSPNDLSLPLFDIEIDSETIDIFWKALEKKTDIFIRFINQPFKFSEIVKMLNCSKVERFYWLFALLEEKIEHHLMTSDIFLLTNGFSQIANNENKIVFLKLIEPLCFNRIQKESVVQAFKLFYCFCEYSDFDSLRSLILKLSQTKSTNAGYVFNRSETRLKQLFEKFDFVEGDFSDLYEKTKSQADKVDLLVKSFGKGVWFLVYLSLLKACLDKRNQEGNEQKYLDLVLYLCSKVEILITTLPSFRSDNLQVPSGKIVDKNEMEEKLFSCLKPVVGRLILKMSVEEFIGFYRALTSKRKLWVFNKYYRHIFKTLNDESKLREFINKIGEKETNKFFKLLEVKVVEGKVLDDDQVDFKPILKIFTHFSATDWSFYFKLLQQDPEYYLLIPDEIKNNRKFIFCAYVNASNIISYLPNNYEKDNELDLEFCIMMMEDFFESAKYFNDDFLLKKAFKILLPHLKFLIKNPDDINDFFNRCSDHQCTILSSINGVHKIFVEQLSLCSIEFLCDSLDKENFPYFLKNNTFLNDVIIQKIVNYQQAGVILNKLFSKSSRGFSFSSFGRQASDLFVLFLVKLYKNTNLPRMSGESIEIMLKEVESLTIQNAFREIILVRHEVLLDINSDMLSILEMIKSYGLEDGFCLSAIKQNALAYEAMPETVKSNVDFTIQAIECNPRIEPFLSESMKEQLPLKTKMFLWQSSVGTSISSIFSSASTKADPSCVISSEAKEAPAA